MARQLTMHWKLCRARLIPEKRFYSSEIMKYPTIYADTNAFCKSPFMPFYHKLLENESNYKSLVFPAHSIKNKCLKNLNIESNAAKNLLSEMFDLDDKHTRAPDKVQRLQKNAHKYAKSMTYEDIVSVFLYISSRPNINFSSSYYGNVVNPLQMQASRLISEMTINQLLFLTDTCLLLQNNGCRFIDYSLDYLSCQLRELNQHQFILFWYLLAATKRYYNKNNSKLQFHSYENITKFRNNISMDELAIICFGLFRNRIKVEDKIVLKYICKMLVISLPYVKEPSLNCILKEIRFSSIYSEIYYKKINQIQESILPYIDTIGWHNFYLIFTLGNRTRSVNDKLFTLTPNFVKKNIYNIPRLKEIVQIMDTFHVQNKKMSEIDTKDLFDDICESIRHLLTTNQHCFELKIGGTLLSMGLYGYFPLDLIENLFISTKRNNYKGTNIVKLIMLQELSKVMDIKLTDKTPFIPENFVKELYIKQSYVDPAFECTKLFSKVYRKIFGNENFICVDNAVGFMAGKDIVFCTNKNDIPVPVPIEYRKLPTTSFKRPTSEDINWNVISPASKYFTMYQSANVSGEAAARLNVLKALGYNSTHVAWKTYFDLRKSDSLENIDLLYPMEVLKPFVNTEWLNERRKSFRLPIPLSKKDTKNFTSTDFLRRLLV